MAFCRKCGNEIPDGVKFCSNCGAGVDEKAAANTILNRISKFFGIILLILAFVDLQSEPPILRIILSVAIIAGAIFCLAQKYRLRGFTIVALVLAVLCLMSGINHGKESGYIKSRELSDYQENTKKIAEEVDEPDYSIKTIKGSDRDENTAKEANTDNNEIKEPDRENDTIDEPDGTDNKPQDSDKGHDGIKETNSNNNAIEERNLDNTTSEEEPVGDLNSRSDIDAGVDESAEILPKTATDIPKGVNPELKDFLDSYERFVDEYVVFMKAYNKDPGNVVTMLNRYTEIMKKYTDFAEALDKYNSNDMSVEDAKYYLEVTNRCTQKMLDIY